jgi:hypothetical protein
VLLPQIEISLGQLKQMISLNHYCYYKSEIKEWSKILFYKFSYVLIKLLLSEGLQSKCFYTSTVYNYSRIWCE